MVEPVDEADAVRVVDPPAFGGEMQAWTECGRPGAGPCRVLLLPAPVARMRCHRRQGRDRRAGQPFTPEEAMELTNARWKATNRASTGTVIIEAYAISWPQETLSCLK